MRRNCVSDKFEKEKVKQLLENPNYKSLVRKNQYSEDEQSSTVLQYGFPQENTLYRATATGNLQLVQNTFEKYPELLNEPNAQGTTCIHLSISRNYFVLFNYLIEKGADVLQEDKNGVSALTLAVKQRKKQYVELLIKVVGINVNTQDSRSQTPLHYAILNSDYEMFQMLLTLGAYVLNTHVETQYLYVAVRVGNRKIVRDLLNRGALSIVNPVTLLTYACRRGGALTDNLPIIQDIMN